METPLDVDSLCLAVERGASFRYRCFWSHQGRKDGALADSCFSQWWPCEFTVAGQPYRSAEQFMMASKARLFGDEETRAAILATEDPREAKALGRKVRGFDEAAWTRVRFDLVTAGNVAKFGQGAPLRAWLLGTGEDVLVEASPVDTIWGIGLSREDARAREPRSWRGLNLLGFALMRTRSILRGEAEDVSLAGLPV